MGLRGVARDAGAAATKGDARAAVDGSAAGDPPRRARVPVPACALRAYACPPQRERAAGGRQRRSVGRPARAAEPRRAPAHVSSRLARRARVQPARRACTERRLENHRGVRRSLTLMRRWELVTPSDFVLLRVWDPLSTAHLFPLTPLLPPTPNCTRPPRRLCQVCQRVDPIHCRGFGLRRRQETRKYFSDLCFLLFG